MSQEQFLSLIAQKPPVDRSSLDFLQQMAQEHPYCQPVRILLAKNLQQFKKEDFEKQVNRASAYATDRRKFQGILSDRPTVDIPLKRKTPQEAEEAVQAARVVIPSKPLPVQEDKKRRKGSVLGWLSQIFGKAPVEEPRATAVPLPQELPAEVEVAPAPPVNSKVNAQRQIIERFLQENPRIEVRKEMFSEENLASRSTVEDQELVSETLAQVLLRQGKKQKALEVYQKLSLKYPEKSSYFAKIMGALTNEITKS